MDTTGVDCFIVEGCTRFKENGPYACLNCKLNFGALAPEIEKQLNLDLYLASKRVEPSVE